MSKLLRVLAVSAAALVLARADEVTLKDGKVLSDLTLVKETDEVYTFLTLEGRRITISKSEVLRYEKKPTARDELKTRLAALKPKDAAATFELATWAKEKGLAKEWRPLMQKVIGIEPDHAEARAALGFVKVEGKWITEAEQARKAAAAEEADYKARGWKQHEGRWVSPADYGRLKAGFVEHQGRWVPKDLKKKIESEGWTFVEGEWVSPADKEKMDGGYRRYQGRWMPIEDLDRTHEDLGDPWIIGGFNVEVHSTAKHRVAVKAAERAQAVYDHLAAFFGEEPDVLGEGGRLVVIVGATIKEYQALGHQYPANDLAARQSSDSAVFYAAANPKGRGAGVTYHQDDAFLHLWVAEAVVHAYLNRFVVEEKVPVPLVNSLRGYFACSHRGKFAPDWFTYTRYLDSRDRPMNPAPGILERAVLAGQAPIDGYIYHAGLMLHFLEQRSPEAFRAFWRGFLGGRGTPARLIETCFGPLKEDGAAKLKQEFDAFLVEYKKNFKPWDK